MHTYVYEHPDGREITVHYEVISYGTPERGRWGPPELYDEGSGPEIDIRGWFDGSGKPLDLDGPTLASIEEAILRNLPEPDDGGDALYESRRAMMED